ncbi:acyltransferase family protein [Lutibacter sp.]|uniref:acyltransferase family protein n=1 Tax=Lutibacter sp. TaxID=1925666 RepID=UPI0035652CAE
MSSTRINRVFGLDLIRSIAIGLVVMSHATLLAFPNSKNPIFTGIRILGAIGVDLFFVLSGFLIGGILLRHIELQKTSADDLYGFWKRRWFRTLPNYFLVLFLNVLIFLFLGNNLPKSILLYIPFLQNFSTSHPDFFTEAWSLSIEEYAYLLLPFLLFFSFKFFKNSNKEKLFLWITLVSIFCLTFLKVLYYFSAEINSYNDWSTSFRKVVIYRIDAVYIGFLAVYIVRKYSKIMEKFKLHLLFTGLLIFILIHVLVYSFNLVPQSSLGFYVFIYLQTIIFSLALLFPYFSALNYSGVFFKPIKFISVNSYSIYLVNYSIVLLGMQEIFDVFNKSILQKIGLILLFLSVSIIFSNIIYRYFELPILKYRDRKYKRG